MAMNEIEETRLIGAAWQGDRAAFASLVAEHQSLACAVAYALTGSFAASEEIAQEAFLAAWKQLAVEPPRNFRAWLCGTVRHLAARFHRSTARFERLPNEVMDDAPGPGEIVDAREAEELVWASLAQMPERYREPLVLFYRMDRSVREVADALELSEVVVRQRLSRGRGMLREAVQAKVEGALVRSAPGRAFAVAVLAAIPAFTHTAQAATMGAALAKGSGAASAGLFASVAGALGGLGLGLMGARLGFRMAMQAAESEREREFLRRSMRWIAGIVLGFLLALGGLWATAGGLARSHPAWWAAALVASIAVFNAAMIGGAMWNQKELRRIRREERLRRGLDPEATPSRGWHFEHRSREEFLGLPLVHVSVGSPADGRRRVARGWLAFGDVAVSPLLAVGGVAVGGVALGGLAIGVFPIGGLALGLVAFGGAAIGGLALGGVALGYVAAGGLALAWWAAYGGRAAAHHFALGGHATAPHANDAAARALFADNALLDLASRLPDYAGWVSVALCLLFGFLLYRLAECRPAGR